MNTIAISEATTAQLLAYFNKHAVMLADGKEIKRFADRKSAEKRVTDLAEKIASHFPELETPEGFIPNPDADETDTQESTGADGAATDDQKPNEAAPESDMDGSPLNLEPSDAPTNEERAAAEALENEGASEVPNNAPVVGSGEEAEDETDEDDEEGSAQRSAKSHNAFNLLQTTLQAINEKQGSEPKPAVKSSGSKASNSDGVAASWADSEVREARLTRDGVKVELEGKEVGTFKSTREAFRALRLPDNKHIRFRLRLKEAHRISGGSETFEQNGKKYVFSIVAIDAE
jgi:hypothetical protein